MTVHVVMGPPCAGKSTYARANARGAPVVDLDDIEVQLGGERYAEWSPVRKRALGIRRKQIDSLVSSGTTAWIIDTLPSPEQADYYRSHGAKFHLVNPGIDVCMERAKQRPPHTAAVIRRWYQTPPQVRPDYITSPQGDHADAERLIRGNEEQGMSEDSKTGGKSGFTPPASQEELDRIIGERVKRERDKFADYEDLKAKAKQVDDAEQAKKSAEQKLADRIAALEAELGKSQQDATRARIQAKYKVSDDDAELFLTAGDAEGLEKQAKALSDRIADRKAKGPVVTSQKGGDDRTPKADPMRELARKVFTNSDD